MRIVDLLRPYEDGLHRLIDATPAGIDIRRHLFTSDEVAVEREEPGATGSLPAGSILLIVLGPDRRRHGDPELLAEALARLEPGARVVVLFGWQPAEVPYHRLLDALTEHRCQVLQVAAVNLSTIGAAAVIERVEELLPPRDPLGEPIIPAPTDASERFALQLRVTNEWVFGDFAARVLRKATLEPGSVDLRLDGDRADLERNLQERDTRLREVERRLTRIESSRSYQLSRALAGASKSPAAFVRLPLDVVRIWRGRGR